MSLRLWYCKTLYGNLLKYERWSDKLIEWSHKDTKLLQENLSKLSKEEFYKFGVDTKLLDGEMLDKLLKKDKRKK